MSYEIPTLATPYPLGVELAKRDGAFLADATPEGLADGLRRLVSPEAAAVGKRGGMLLREEFSWDQVARTWLSQVEAIV